MESNPNQFISGSEGFKRASQLSSVSDSDDGVFNKPQKKFGFGPASKLGNNPKNDDEEVARYKNYKLDEKILTSHWLFSDESPKNVDIQRVEPTHFKPSSLVTTRVSSIDENTGFKFASGKRCPNLNFAKTDQMRKFLGLDDVVDDLNENKSKSSKSNKSESSKLRIGLTVSRQPTSNVYDELYFRTQSIAETIVDTGYKPPEKTCYLEIWNEFCTFTKYKTTKISLEVIYKLWRQYRNPFEVNFTDVEFYNYLLFTTDNKCVSVGGLNVITKCFKKIVSNMNMKIKRELFDESWVNDKFKILTLNVCRRYTRKIKKMRETLELEQSILNVPLPNPIKLLKKLVSLVEKESSGHVSILNKIFQREASPDIPVVLRVEAFDGTDAYLTDGLELYKARFSDFHIKGYFETNKIKMGNKILIQGIIYKEVREEFVLLLSYNSVSLANKRPMGLQTKHSNVNIKDMIVGGGRVSRVEVIVLRTFPMVYKVWYRSPEHTERQSVNMSENEYQDMMHDTECEFIGQIERVSMHFTMFVVDAVMLTKEAPNEEFDKMLAKSCIHIALLNVDDTISYILKPLTRLVLTNTFISYLGDPYYFYKDKTKRVPLRLCSTAYSKLEIMENKIKVPEVLGSKSALSKDLFNKLPSLSQAEDFDDLDAFLKLHFNFHKENVFLGQPCDLNGIILYVGEINQSSKFCNLRFFMLTTKLHLVSVKVDYRNSLEINDKLKIPCEIRSLSKKLKAATLTLTAEKKKPENTMANMFYTLNNLQYTGLDDQHWIYNFQVNSEQLIFKSSQVLKSLQKSFKEKELMFKENNVRLSVSTYKSLKETHIDNICKIFFKTIANNIIEVYRLVQCDSEQIKELEELMVT